MTGASVSLPVRRGALNTASSMNSSLRGCCIDECRATAEDLEARGSHSENNSGNPKDTQSKYTLKLCRRVYNEK